MENNEKYIARNLRNHREDIDLDDLWSDVSPHIPKEKKRKRIGLWIFSGLLIMMLVVSILIVTNLPQNAANISLATIEDLNNYQHGDSVDEKVTSIIQEVDNNSNNKIQQTEKAVAKSPIKKKYEFAKKQEKLNIKTNNQTTGSQDIKHLFEKTKLSKTIASKSDVYNNNLLEVDSFSKSDTEQIRKDKQIQKPLATINDRITVETKLLPIQSFRLLGIERNINRSQLKMSVPEINNSFSHLNKWSTYVLGGIAAVGRDLTLRSAELKEERDRRDAIVDVLGAWEIEGGIGFRLSPRLKIMTGVNYTLIHEKANYVSEELVDFEVVTDALIMKQDGSIEQQTESYPGQGIRRIEEVRYNQLKLLQIPVRLTYQLVNINRVKLNIGGLFSYSVWQEYDGFTSFSSSANSYDLLLDEENKFRNSGSVSYGMFLDGTTHLTDLVDISFGIGYKQINRINSEIYLIDQQYNSFTLTSGISRRF